MTTPFQEAGAEPRASYTIFLGHRRLLQGDRQAVLRFLQSHEQRTDGKADESMPWVFEDHSGMRLDLDWRSELAATAATAATSHAAPNPPARSVGRPKLGVVAREVTLLPRHWEWLNRQPGGASGALRRLVEEARGKHAEQDAMRAATEASYRFMSEIAGDLPHFEEASRALFARQADAFAQHTAAWPEDVRSYLRQLSQPLWPMQG
ncbi:Uncharacterized protein conserved in bacteria [Delftia tsuruhatensis]|uniref:DUF2239 family protein n=1 Tax=Delftia tsuruhatensis TaxID=180282 RepID=UPI001E7B96F2|nr:DUF2239 family protein [Delftia tsuruhatensis]CAB5694580.1 Uncharacterized protein conserved in bacteria [Delftia tsuruhatensis]CAC9687147.1 Uncharacterized protein conserved in bacteria [Delftia tsuruhatensis]